MPTHFLRKIDPATGMFIEDVFWDDGATAGIPAIAEVFNPDGSVLTPAVAAIPAVLGNPIPADMIATAVPGGFGHPKWDGTTWVEGKDPVLMAAQAAISLISILSAAVQKHLDDTAKTHGYDGILSACTYATDTHPPFQAEGQTCVNWRGAVWAACYQIMAAVQAGTHAVPTAESLIAELPSMVWPA